MKKRILSISLLSLSCLVNAQSVNDKIHATIRQFYERTSGDNGRKYDRDSIFDIFLTKACKEKIHRSEYLSGVPIPDRSMDYPDETPSVNIHSLGNNWYNVVLWENVPIYKCQVPLKISTLNDEVRISYIVPVWNGLLYGDELFFEKREFTPVKAASALDFVKQFYEIYAKEYCYLEEDLKSRRDSIRQLYLTPKAITDCYVAETAIAQREDDNPNEDYDLVINSYDFDRLWIPWLKFQQIDEQTFHVSYIEGSRGESWHKIEVSVVPSGGSYKINRLKVLSKRAYFP